METASTNETERLQREVDRLHARARVLAIIVGVLSGFAGGLIAGMVSRHYGATGLECAVYGGGTFVGFSTFVLFVEEKLKLV
ncbi:hypothetical protein AB0D99_31725 [Streptomyces sp. NPDC047971]|uniref:hypothetical protein n=1 Tax=Streptomyces sp. NPDC047971 TaxID=3154499 RepID=UPI0033E748CC